MKRKTPKRKPTKKKSTSKKKTVKAHGTKKHGKVRITCYKCGKNHSASDHRFHGVGSYARTH